MKNLSLQEEGFLGCQATEKLLTWSGTGVGEKTGMLSNDGFFSAPIRQSGVDYI